MCIYGQNILLWATLLKCIFFSGLYSDSQGFRYGKNTVTTCGLSLYTSEIKKKIFKTKKTPTIIVIMINNVIMIVIIIG